MRIGVLIATHLLSMAAWADVRKEESLVDPDKLKSPAGSVSEIVVQTAHEMASTISRLDVEGLLQFIPETDAVVYVSDGFPIRGDEYRKEIGEYYQTLKSLNFKWERWETVPLSDTIVIFTGWANTSFETLAGEQGSEQAVFTMVWMLDSSGWKRVIAHKTILSD